MASVASSFMRSERPIAAESWLPSSATAPRADEFLHGVDDEAWIRAVADQIAEEDVALNRQACSVREAGLQRLAVAVDVGQECDQHCEHRGSIGFRKR